MRRQGRHPTGAALYVNPPAGVNQARRRSLARHVRRVADHPGALVVACADKTRRP